MKEPAVIPRPAELAVGYGALHIGDRTEILADTESRGATELLAGLLPAAAGGPRTVAPARGHPRDDTITLAVDGTRSDLGSEGYELTVTPKRAKVTGGDRRGVLWGVQTVRQLLALGTGPAASLPAVTIRDRPRFAWRGLLLDVARHFFPIAFIERLLDLMALYKLNTFHWHLTDDQGWRIEVRSRPRLTEVGSRRSATPLPHDRHRSDGTPYRGHYTQDQVRRVVAYAAARGITVVPEIEMPGHALAALASYPELGCRGQGYQVGTSWGIMSEVLCAGRESTFAFLEEVLSEVLELFPSRFIHVGGDECPKQSWRGCRHCQERRAAEGLRDEDELQSWFIRRIDTWLAHEVERVAVQGARRAVGSGDRAVPDAARRGGAGCRPDLRRGVRAHLAGGAGGGLRDGAARLLLVRGAAAARRHRRLPSTCAAGSTATGAADPSTVVDVAAERGD